MYIKYDRKFVSFHVVVMLGACGSVKLCCPKLKFGGAAQYVIATFVAPGAQKLAKYPSV